MNQIVSRSQVLADQQTCLVRNVERVALRAGDTRLRFAITTELINLAVVGRDAIGE